MAFCSKTSTVGPAAVIDMLRPGKIEELYYAMGSAGVSIRIPITSYLGICILKELVEAALGTCTRSRNCCCVWARCDHRIVNCRSVGGECDGVVAHVINISIDCTLPRLDCDQFALVIAETCTLLCACG